MTRILSEVNVGDEVTVLISRDGVIKELRFTLPENKQADYVIEPVADATPEQIAIRNIWLSTN